MSGCVMVLLCSGDRHSHPTQRCNDDNEGMNERTNHTIQHPLSSSLADIGWLVWIDDHDNNSS